MLSWGFCWKITLGEYLCTSSWNICVWFCHIPRTLPVLGHCAWHVWLMGFLGLPEDLLWAVKLLAGSCCHISRILNHLCSPHCWVTFYSDLLGVMGGRHRGQCSFDSPFPGLCRPLVSQCDGGGSSNRLTTLSELWVLYSDPCIP